MVDGNRDVHQSKDSERLNEFISVTKKEKFARHLKKICKRFVNFLKFTHLIKI